MIFLAPLAGIWLYARYIDPGAAAPYDAGNARAFDRRLWRMDERVLRYQMASDLLARTDFIGWDRDRVEDLLGESTPAPEGFEIDAGEQWGMSPTESSTVRAFALVFTASARGEVERVRFECRGRC